MNCEDYIRRVTGHRNVAITSRGNEGILRALKIIRELSGNKFILIPDQGGWLSYRDLIKKSGFEVKELKTDKALILVDELNKQIKDCAGFLYCGFGGYFVEEPVKEIVDICKKNNVFVILDVSGCFSDEICSKEYADFMVGSFSKWKVVDYGKCGFVSSDYDVGESADYDDKLFEKLKVSKESLNRLLELSKEVKEDLSNFEVFHRNKRGINVVTEYNKYIFDYCKKKNYEFVICPKIYKVLEKAISIEIKRLR